MSSAALWRRSWHADQTLLRIGEVGGDGFAAVADMRDPRQVLAMVRSVAERGGRVDYVVSNAAINYEASVSMKDETLCCNNSELASVLCLTITLSPVSATRTTAGSRPWPN